MQYFFGSGALYGRQTGVSNPTPIRFGALQNASVDFAFTNKSLYGQYQFPVDTSRGTCKITGKATFGGLNAATLNNMFFGESSLGTTPTFTAIDEQGTVTANTVTVTNNSTYVEDLGVINVTDGSLLMTRVSAAPAGTGNYAVNETTGVYTFNSAMNAKVVAISYDYTSAGSGQNITIPNQLTGAGPQFLIVLAGSLKGNAMRLKLNACMSSKMGLATKLEDYLTPDFEWEAFADTSGNVGQFSFAQ